MSGSVLAIIGLVAFVGSVIQATMGFGGAMIMINILPFFMPVSRAVALVQGSVIAFNLVYFCIYFRKIRWDVVLPAAIPSVIIGLVFTFVSVSIDVAILTIALGALFIGLALYYLCVVDRLHVVPSRRNGVIMGSLSGLTNAFFGMAGPPVALYLAPSFDDNLEYFASSQAFFLLSSVACISVRIFTGVYSASDVPVLLYLMALILLGSFIGVKILKKVNAKSLKRLIYVFIGLNGVYIIVKQLLG